MEAPRMLINLEKNLDQEYVTEAHTAANAPIQQNQAARDERAEILQLVIEIASKNSLGMALRILFMLVS
jgi:hypothetical protein